MKFKNSPNAVLVSLNKGRLHSIFLSSIRKWFSKCKVAACVLLSAPSLVCSATFQRETLCCISAVPWAGQAKLQVAPLWRLSARTPAGTSETLTFNELGSKGGSVSAEVDVGTFLQDERVFLVKRVTTWYGQEGTPWIIQTSLGRSLLEPLLADSPSVSGAVGARCRRRRVSSSISRWLSILLYFWMSLTFCPDVPRNLHLGKENYRLWTGTVRVSHWLCLHGHK